MMRNQHRSNPAPSTVSSSVRTRDYLTTREIDALMAAAPAIEPVWARATPRVISATDMVCGLPSCVDLPVEPSRAGGGPSSAESEERNAQRPSAPGRRDTRSTAATARTGGISAGLLVRSWWADDAQVLSWFVCPDWRARWPILPCAPSHAPAWLRLCPSQCGSRHPRLAGLAWTQEHPTHRALHRTSSGSVQKFLEVTTATPGKCAPGVGENFWAPSSDCLLECRAKLEAMRAAGQPIGRVLFVIIDVSGENGP